MFFLRHVFDHPIGGQGWLMALVILLFRNRKHSIFYSSGSTLSIHIHSVQQKTGYFKISGSKPLQKISENLFFNSK